MTTTARLLLTASFIGLAVGAGGCIIIPTPNGLFPGPNRYEGTVGPADSKAPIHVGVSDRARVRAVLGEPYISNYDKPPEGQDPPWRYYHYTATGYWIWLWPFVHGGPINSIDREDELAIWFGPDDQVAGYYVWSGGGDPVRPPAVDEAYRLRLLATASGPAASQPWSRPQPPDAAPP